MQPSTMTDATVIESPPSSQPPLETSSQNPPPPFTDPEMARLAGIKGQAALQARRQLEQEAAESGLPEDKWLRERCRRIREIILSVEDDLAKSEDAQDRNWSAAALNRLYDIERMLAGRPAPGTLKPVVGKSKTPADLPPPK